MKESVLFVLLILFAAAVIALASHTLATFIVGLVGG
jgi:hypothetical protein